MELEKKVEQKTQFAKKIEQIKYRWACYMQVASETSLTPEQQVNAKILGELVNLYTKEDENNENSQDKKTN